MPVPLKKIMDALPPARRAKIEARAAELMAEEMSLAELRKACVKTQTVLARKLKIGQDGISKIEKRSDLLISTLRHYVKALGGDLHLVVKFENRPAVSLGGFADMGSRAKPPRRSRPTA